MKKLKWLNLSVFLVLALLFSACGSDSEEVVGTTDSTSTTTSTNSSTTSTSTTTSTKTASSWEDFYSKVESGNFVSIDTFKSNYGISNYSTVIFKFLDYLQED